MRCRPGRRPVCRARPVSSRNRHAKESHWTRRKTSFEHSRVQATGDQTPEDETGTGVDSVISRSVLASGDCVGCPPLLPIGKHLGPFSASSGPSPGSYGYRTGSRAERSSVALRGIQGRFHLGCCPNTRRFPASILIPIECLSSKKSPSSEQPISWGHLNPTDVSPNLRRINPRPVFWLRWQPFCDSLRNAISRVLPRSLPVLPRLSRGTLPDSLVLA